MPGAGQRGRWNQPNRDEVAVAPCPGSKQQQGWACIPSMHTHTNTCSTRRAGHADQQIPSSLFYSRDHPFLRGWLQRLQGKMQIRSCISGNRGREGTARWRGMEDEALSSLCPSPGGIRALRTACSAWPLLAVSALANSMEEGQTCNYHKTGLLFCCTSIWKCPYHANFIRALSVEGSSWDSTRPLSNRGMRCQMKHMNIKIQISSMQQLPFVLHPNV